MLVSAPTGSGKTLAAFLSCLDDLVCRRAAETLPEETLVVYVSPLKALTNDVRKNLELPLAELRRARSNAGWRLCRNSNGSAHRRYAGERAAADAAQAAARARHDAGIALHSPNGREVARALPQRLDRRRRRNSRDRQQQARIASCADAGAARRSGRLRRRSANRNASACRRRFVRSSASQLLEPDAPRSSTSAAAARWSSRSRFRATNSARSPAARCGQKSTTSSPS